jgi:hypothetical protein
MPSVFRRLIAVAALVLGLGASVGATVASAATPYAAPSHTVHTNGAPGDWWWE